jgi:CheY-like chemotaxis protein
MMPNLDGIETTRRIRAMHVPSAEVPIVALVAQTKKHHCGTYLAVGMTPACSSRSRQASFMQRSLRTSRARNSLSPC